MNCTTVLFILCQRSDAVPFVKSVVTASDGRCFPVEQRASRATPRSTVASSTMQRQLATSREHSSAVMMRAVQLLLVLSGLTAVACVETAAEAPIQRRIVEDLTPVLLQQLHQSNISLLLVLPGTQAHTTMNLDWRKVTDSVERLNFVYDYEGFKANWHGYHRYHRWHQQQLSHKRSSTDHKLAATDAPLEPSEFDDIAPVVNPTPPRIALLLRADNGAVRSSLANLAAAITGHLSRAHVLTFTYSTHEGKGDTLLAFTGLGVPIQANFLATAVFRDAFSAIYDKNKWGAGANNGDGSGPGSSVPYTAKIRAALPALIKKYKINSMLDSSCGSMHWMPLVLREVKAQNKEFRFMGTDVVCSLIDRHLQTFKNETDWKFQCVDYSNQGLPSGYDLVWSRDSLQHIPMHGVWQFLNNVKASGAKYLLVGSYIKSTGKNINIAAGGYYDIDLTKEPFKLAKPLEIIDEQTPDGKHMLLFDVQKMTWEDTLDGLV